MIPLTPEQQSAIAGPDHDIKWVFEVTDNASSTHYWSTAAVTFDGRDYSPVVVGETWGGVVERRRCVEDGRFVATETTFDVADDSLDPDDFSNATVVVRILADNIEIRAWKFAVISCGKAYGLLRFSCRDLLAHVLALADYPLTRYIKGIWPDKNAVRDTMCVPVPFGTAYVPLRPVWCTPSGRPEGRYYLLGPGTTGYTVMKIRTPRECPHAVEWSDGFSICNADGYKVLYAEIADTDMDGDADAQGLWWTNRLLDAPVKFARHDTAHLTNPGDILAWILQDMGVDPGDIDVSAKTQYDAWDLRWDGALLTKEDRSALMARLLVQCAATLDPQERVTLRILSADPVATITPSDVLGRSWRFWPAVSPDHDSGYIAWQGADPVVDDDPTFEKSAGTWGDYWARVASTGAPALPDMDTAYGRSGYGVRITAPGAGEYAYIYNHPACPASANDNISIIADLRSNALTGGTVGLVAWYYGSSGYLGSVRTNIETSLSDGSWVNVRTTVTLPNDSNIISVRVGIIVNNSISGSIDIDNIFGFVASSADRVDEPWDQYHRLVVPVASSTDKPSSVTYVMDFVHHQASALKLGQLAVQRTLGVYAYASVVVPPSFLGLQPYDVIQVSGDHYGAATYDVDEIQVRRDGTMELRLRRYRHSLKNWGDITPTVRTPADPDGQMTWSPVIYGPDDSAGQNAIKGRVSIGTDKNTRIILDSNHPDVSGPLIELIEATKRRFRLGKLGVNNYGITIENALGQTIILIDSSKSKLSGWTIEETAIKSNKITLDSANERITISDDTRERAWFGRISDDNYGVLMRDAAGNNILLIDSSKAELAGWSLSGTRIYKDNIEINAAEPSIKVWNGDNFVKLSPAGLVAYDETLGQTLLIPTNGDPPQFASGIIKEAIYQIYEAGVIKTADDPSETGGVIINNTGIKGYNDAGALKFFLDAATGRIWAEDAEISGTVTVGPGSSVPWGYITGTGKPEDNATVGATWSDNITGQPSDPELLNAAQFIEPCEDTGAWNANTNSTIATDTDNFSGDYSIKITWNGTADPASSGTTGGAYIAIPERIALGFGGKRIKVTVYAKQPSTGASSEFAVAYSTNDVGNSGWNKFTPTTSWAPYTFYYDVPEPSSGGTDFLGVWADTSHSGLSILIDNIVIEATVKESELDALDLTNAPAEAGATNDATWRHPSDTTKIDGGKLYVGSHIVIADDGHIRSGQTAFNTGTGWWIGDDDGTPKMSIGSPNGHRLLWTGSSLDYYGALRDLTPWETTKTANFTAESNKRYPIDTSFGEVVMTLPSDPAVNDKISWLDLTRSFDTHAFLIDPNGRKFEGETYAAGDLVEIHVEGLNGTIEYTGTTYGWKILAVA